MKRNILIVAALAAAAGAYAWTRPHNVPPADLRDAVADSGEFNISLPVLDKNGGNKPEPKAARAGGVNKGYVASNDPSFAVPEQPVEWVVIPGGRFTMGTDNNEKWFANAKPVHEVTIKTFNMSKTDVTVEQYAECVIKGHCTEPTAPSTGDYCNWGDLGRKLHPVNCVTWDQAVQYAKFKGARLPSEAEWEYAATSGGRNQKYPWGNEEPTCDTAIMTGEDGQFCGQRGTKPVCSVPAGNTAQGLCDMMGNVWQWLQDNYVDSYKNTPVDGSAFVAPHHRRVTRGGSFNDPGDVVRADFRSFSYAGERFRNVGFRIAK